MYKILEFILKIRNDIDYIRKTNETVIKTKHGKINALRRKKIALFGEWRIATNEKDVLRKIKDESSWFRIDLELEAAAKCIAINNKPVEAKMHLIQAQGMIAIVAPIDVYKKMTDEIQKIIELCGNDENDYSNDSGRKEEKYRPSKGENIV